MLFKASVSIRTRAIQTATKKAGAIGLMAVGLMLTVFQRPGIAQASGQEASASEVNCRPVSANTPPPQWPAHIHGTITASPTVAFNITENGKVEGLALKRSSGVRAYDQAIMKAVKQWTYKPAPGCGVRESTATFNLPR